MRARPSAGDEGGSKLVPLPTDWLIYDEAVRSFPIVHVRCCTVVSPVTVALFAGQSRLRSEVIRETEAALLGSFDSSSVFLF